jgi:hypothetical protein
MSTYRIGTQKTAKGHKVVLYSTANGKLVLAGESLARSIDAVNMANELRDAFNSKRETMPMEPIEAFPASHRWTKNSGPKKKAPVPGYTHIGSKGPIDFFANNDSMRAFAKGKKKVAKKAATKKK